MLLYLEILCILFIVLSQGTLFHNEKEYPSASFLINKWRCDPSRYIDVVASGVALKIHISERCEFVYPTEAQGKFIAVIESTPLQLCLQRDKLFQELLEHPDVIGAILLEFEQNTAAKFYYHYPNPVCNLKLFEIVYLPYSKEVKDTLYGASVNLSFGKIFFLL